MADRREMSLRRKKLIVFAGVVAALLLAGCSITSETGAFTKVSARLLPNGLQEHWIHGAQ
jgi:hypothetical protein